MNIECIKDKIKKALVLTDKITAKNSTLPVLSCVLFCAKDNKLKIKATNLDIGVEIDVPAKISKEGVCAIPGDVVRGFVSNISEGGGISFSFEDDVVKVSTSQNKTTIKTLSSDDFPSIPVVSGEQMFSVDSSMFVKGLKSVWYSASFSSMKPELSSVYVYPDDGHLVFVATDSFRLAEKKIKTKATKNFDSVLIPFKNIPEIIKVLEIEKGEVEVHLSENQIAFLTNGVYLTSRIVSGNFPDYKQILPKEFTTEVIVLKEDFSNALRASSVFSDKFNQANISVDSKEKVFSFSTKNKDVGENTNILPATVKGDPIDIRFNYKYLSDCLSSIDSDSISFSFNGSNKPLIIQGVSDRSFTYMVMPMNK
ncbi:MAG: DNA polymerase III subunit beta [Parcubacteria group bacterium CG11_big_fil_rev_8_21_14_0_20_39_22]|nr:MAG: DNA polymerase III subunit beta [Parcubacteria group bacterium CG11_big_fil_rev_8_21_14_0_20_39_22]